jgi:hypothetical protein
MNDRDDNDSQNSKEPARISVGVRQMYALPLYALFILIAMAVITEPKFEQMFKEMGIGTLPATTALFLTSINTIHAYPYIFMPMLLSMAWLFFGWGCQNRRRMVICSCLAVFAAVGFFFWMVSAYFEPLMQIMSAYKK